MNFLSHYYFDRNNKNPYEVLGVVLPDLLKNANKTWNPHPQKNEHLFNQNIHHQEILKGWKRHLQVDKLFHNSDFFFHHQHQIKLCLKDALTTSPVKPFFLGHVSLELMLDSLLITTQKINIDDFYYYLNLIDIHVLNSFLMLNGISNTDSFFLYFNNFKKEKYLNSYAQTDKITYALEKICMRIWEQPFTPDQENAITHQLLTYKKKLSEEFIFIFEWIEANLV